MNSHNLVNIHPEAKLGKNVVVSPFSTIEKDVIIGDNTYIHSNVSILNGARIGKNCTIFPGAVISAVPQDLKFKGEESTVEIGDNNLIREYVTINRGTQSRGRTVVGNNCLLMAYVHVAHDCIIGNHVIIGNTTQIAGEVIIEDYATLSGGCLIHQFCNIGKHVMIQGGSKVGKDVPPYVTAGRDPLSFFGINSIGLRRRGFSNEQIEVMQNVYRYIYYKGLNNSDAIDLIGAELQVSPELEEIVSFIKKSDRGIIKG